MTAPADLLDPVDDPPSRAWAIAVLVTSWSLAALAAVLVLFTNPSWHTGQWYGLVDTSDAIVFGATAALLLARGRHPVSWLVALCAIGGGLAAVGFQWSMVAIEHPTAPDLAWLQTAQSTAWLPGTYAMIIIVPVLVRRRPLRTVDRVFLALSAVIITSLTLIRLTDPYPWPDGQPGTPFAITSTWWLEFCERTAQAQFAIVCVLAAVAIADLVRRWRQQSNDDRRGLGWLAIGATLMTAAFIPLALPADWTSGLPDWMTPVLHLTSQLFFPAALLVAVLRQRIHGLEFVVGRTTMWMLLSGALLGIYVAIVAIGSEVLPTDDGLVLAIATAVVAVSISPLRRVLQRRIDALIRGDVSVPTQAFSGMARRLGSATDTELLEVIADSVVHALRLGGLAIEVDWPGGARRVASVGELSRASIETRDLIVSREVVGRVIVSGRHGERLDRTTLDSLDDLTPVVAMVVQLVARTRELTESRARIASARDEERRVLRRELHDGFGPGLAGVALGLRAAENLLATDAAAAGPLVRQMADEIDERVEEVRTLARGLLPPALDDLGLIPALVELAERYQVLGDLDVRVTAVDDVVVDVVTRQAIYGIVAEAVRNVVRHAAATTCHITLASRNGFLTVTVDDDGTGIPASPNRGVGLTSMRERADGIGATLTIAGRRQGTRVQMIAPFERSRAGSTSGINS